MNNMPTTKPNCLCQVFQLFLFAVTVVLGKADISVPVSINPIVQDPLSMTLAQSTSFFYEMDTEFYSRVTVGDVARNAGKDVSEIIQKKVSVLLLVAASSRVSGSLTVNNLMYPKGESKWSYQIPLEHVLRESNGTVTQLTDQIPVYKIQELAMKVLERRYGFSVARLLTQLGLNQMEFYGVDETGWIDVVGEIIEQVIHDRSNSLNLTPCYLAELINKTKDEMTKFTLHEVDAHLYNISTLTRIYPAYWNLTVSRLHKAFDITASQLALMSNVEEEEINRMGIKDLLQLLTKTVSEKLDLDPLGDRLEDYSHIPCSSKWDAFRRNIVQKAHANAARSLSITSETLASITNIPQKQVETFSFPKMIQVFRTIIRPIQDDKRKIEEHPLSMLKRMHLSWKLSTRKHNAISMIKRITNFSKQQLQSLYGWTASDFHFARLFTVADIARECKLIANNYSLLLLARINTGQAKPGVNCRSFTGLRMIWGETSLNKLKEVFHLEHIKVAIDKPIAVTVSELTNSSMLSTLRVLSNTPAIRSLLTKMTLNNISSWTNYTTDHLKALPFQRILIILYDMYNAGSFGPTIKANVVATTDEVSVVSTEENVHRKGTQSSRQEKPRQLPRSSSSTRSQDRMLLAILVLGTLIL